MKITQKAFLEKVNGKEMALIARVNKIFFNTLKAEAYIHEIENKIYALMADQNTFEKYKNNAKYDIVRSTSYGFMRGDSRFDVKGYVAKQLANNVFIAEYNQLIPYAVDETFHVNILVYITR